MILTIISFIAAIATIIHVWKTRSFSTGICVAISIGLLLFGWIGLLIYWIYILQGRKVSPTEAAIAEIEQDETKYTGKDLSKKLHSHIVAALLCEDFSQDDRCVVLEVLYVKVKKFYEGDNSKACAMFLNAYKVATKGLEEMMPGCTLGFIDINEDLEKNALKPLNEYLGTILSLVGLIHSEEGKFHFNPADLEKYTLPTF